LSRGPAIIATALALALVNIGLAALIVAAMGAQSFAPLWVGALVLVLGAAAAVGAVMLWRQYLQAARGD
jgi:protein-S-isoprenylcysteine O-methyltransferase Ste14